MALRPARSARLVPKDAVVLNEMDAVGYQGEIIDKWQPQSEVFFLRYGMSMLGTAAMLSAFVINSDIRRRLKLYSFGNGVSILLTAGSSVVLLCSAHIMHIRKRIFLSDETLCSACVDARAVFVQNVGGILQPLLAGSAMNFGFAYKMATVNMPRMLDVKNMARFWWTVVKPMSQTLMVMSLCHSILATSVITRQLREFSRIRESLLIQESFFEESGAKPQTFHTRVG